MSSWVKGSPVMAGVLLAAAGVVALFLGWNGAAGVDHVEGQIPYLISGGLLGIGLIGAGLVVVNVQARRQDQAELLARLDELSETVRDLAGPAASVGTLTAVPAGDIVVAGASTYHLPSCRVVADRTDLLPLSPSDAASRGLTRCRICKPPAAVSA